MRAEELMIGDWVMFDGNPSVVAGVRVGGRESFVQIGFVSCSPEYVEPIPITAEILEKNGFVKSRRCNTWMWIKMDMDACQHSIDVEFYENKSMGIRVAFSGICVAYYANKWYVHQLQQIIRMIGIDKEIIV